MSKRYQVPNKPMCPYCDESSYIQFCKGDWWGATFKCDICDREFLYSKKRRYSCEIRRNYQAYYRLIRVEENSPSYDNRHWQKLLPDSILNSQLWHDARNSRKQLQLDSDRFAYKKYALLWEAKKADLSLGKMDRWLSGLTKRGAISHGVVLRWRARMFIMGNWQHI
jgi:hypothetical protein